MKTELEVLFAPAELASLAARDLDDTACVVFDILRATTTMITALANGALAVIPTDGIAEAVDLRRRHPNTLLAGERRGLRIRADLSGGIDFDLGNSPREFTADRVVGRTIIMTTSNGTGALRAAARARRVFVAGFLNLSAIALAAQEQPSRRILILCSGTLEESSFEDTLAAGALCDLLWPHYPETSVADSVNIARQLYLANRADLMSAMSCSRNARRLLSHPDLRDDVPFCLQRDTVPYATLLDADGAVRLVRSWV